MPDDKPAASFRFACGVRQTQVTKFSHTGDATPETRDDWVIVEEPLELRVAGEPFLVTMRTPGHDHELAAGFLVAEGIVKHRSALGGIRHCDPGPDPKNNVIDVLPAPGTVLETEHLVPRLSWSSCGLCGRDQISDLLERAPRISHRRRWQRAALQQASAGLSALQLNYAKTGGGHAAAAVTADGNFECVREDVGRHNAVDKVVGRLLLADRLPAEGRALLVSGRVSFEIVQKAAMAGFELVIAVSAPSSLAITSADSLGLTLVGFSRGTGFNVYAGEAWVSAD